MNTKRIQEFAEEIKEFTQESFAFLKNKLRESEINWHRNDMQQRQNQLLQMKFQQSMQLQLELFQILYQTNISPALTRLHYAQELLPDNFPCPNNIYQYSWTKSQTDIISVTMLNHYVQKMNTAINMERLRLHNTMQTVTPYMQNQLCQLYPCLCRGFHIISCQDNYDSIILSVVLN